MTWPAITSWWGGGSTDHIPLKWLQGSWPKWPFNLFTPVVHCGRLASICSSFLLCCCFREEAFWAGITYFLSKANKQRDLSKGLWEKCLLMAELGGKQKPLISNNHNHVGLLQAIAVTKYNIWLKIICCFFLPLTRWSLGTASATGTFWLT